MENAKSRTERGTRQGTNGSAQSVWLLLTVCCLLALTVPRIATADSNPVSAPSVPNYRLRPGDVLELAVPTHDGFNASLAVQPDGRIYYPFLGEIMVSGLTIPELTERIRRGLEKELRAPQVTI